MGNTICIYRHSEAGRRDLSEMERKWPDGQQSRNKISLGYGDRLQSSLVS